jgi:hypothetical protein
MGTIAEVSERIRERSLRPDSEAYGGVLRRAGVNIGRLWEELEDFLTKEDSAMLCEPARETATHYVWPLVLDRETKCGLFIHEFKTLFKSPTAYASSIHSHRYHFASLLMIGGYTEERFRVERSLHDDCAAAGIELLWRRLVSAAEVSQVHAHEFHRLSSIQPGTISLVLKSPPVTKSSESVDPASMAIATHIPVEDRLSFLIDAVRSALGRTRSAPSVGDPDE